MACTSDPSRPSSWAICRFERFRPMKYRHSTQTRSGWWCPASTVPVRSSKRPVHALHRYRCRWAWVSSKPSRTTVLLPQAGQWTPSGQRCWRTRAKHLASSISAERLTRSATAISRVLTQGGRLAPSSPTIIEALQARYPDLLPPPRNPIRAFVNIFAPDQPDSRDSFIAYDLRSVKFDPGRALVLFL